MAPDGAPHSRGAARTQREAEAWAPASAKAAGSELVHTRPKEIEGDAHLLPFLPTYPPTHLLSYLLTSLLNEPGWRRATKRRSPSGRRIWSRLRESPRISTGPRSRPRSFVERAALVTPGPVAARACKHCPGSQQPMRAEAYRRPARSLDFCIIWAPEECPGETLRTAHHKQPDLARPGPTAQPTRPPTAPVMRPPTAPDAHPHACRVFSVQCCPPPASFPGTHQPSAATLLPCAFAARGSNRPSQPVKADALWQSLTPCSCTGPGTVQGTGRTATSGSGGLTRNPTRASSRPKRRRGRSGGSRWGSF